MILITKETKIIEILEAHPNSGRIFQQFGMGCTGCMGAAMESLENGARMHGVELSALLRVLEDLVKESG